MTLALGAAAIYVDPPSYNLVKRTFDEMSLDVKNVKNFGAKGDGVTNDAAAIQAAVDYVTSPYSSTNRGTIFFPPGRYVCLSSITISTGGEISICFEGCGDASWIEGNSANFMIDRVTSPYGINGGIFSVSKLRVSNSATGGGGIRYGCTVCATVYDCDITADLGISCSNEQAHSPDNVAFTTGIYNCRIRPWNNYGSGTTGFYINNNSTAVNCDISGYETGGRLTGTACSVIGGRYELNGIGIALGIFPDGTAGSITGFTLQGFSMESNNTAIYMRGGSGVVSGLYILANNLAAPGGIDPAYGFRCNNESTNRVKFQGIQVGGYFSVAAFSVAAAGSGLPSSSLYNTYDSVNAFVTGGGGVGWELPNSPGMCGTWTECSFMSPIQTVANLPTDPQEGDEHNVSDGTDGLTWGVQCTNTGSHTTHYRVRWNGSQWMVIAK